MDPQAIFLLQFLTSIAAWSVVAWLFVSPWLAGTSRRVALAWLALPHMFRHLGMVFLVPWLSRAPLPDGFAYAAAYGDLAAGILAIVTVVALHRRWAAGVALAWLLNLVGLFDLGNALRHTDVATNFGTTWYIPTMVVPVLLVTHFMMFRRLLGPFRTSTVGPRPSEDKRDEPRRGDCIHGTILRRGAAKSAERSGARFTRSRSRSTPGGLPERALAKHDVAAHRVRHVGAQ